MRWQSKTADFTFNLTPPEPLPDEPKAPAARATPAQKAAYKKACCVQQGKGGR